MESTTAPIVGRRMLLVVALLLALFLDRGGSLQAPPEPFEEFDEEFLDLSLRAARISADLLLAPDPTTNIPGALVYRDEGSDFSAMVGYFGGVCFGVFADDRDNATTSLDDLFDPIDNTINYQTCGLAGCCPTRQTFHEALLGATFFNIYMQTLRACATLCSNSNPQGFCDVVFTGFSQGGALAQVAGVVMEDLNPTILTFGQPTTSQIPCSGVDPSRLFRFVNTMVDPADNATLLYDGVPSVFVAGTSQSGQEFVLAPREEGGIAYMYDNNGTDVIQVPPEDWAFGANFLEVHNAEAYFQRLEEYKNASLFNATYFPLSLNGFVPGSPCTIDSDECAPPEFCNPAEDGSAICAVSAPPSQVPVPTGAPSGTPTTPVPTAAPSPRPTRLTGLIGDFCFGEEGCLPTNTCEFGICVAKRPTGSFCNEGTDCVSGICQANGRFLPSRCL